MKTNSALNRKVQLAFGPAIATLLVLPAIAYRSMVVSSESERWVQRSLDVLQNPEESLFATRSIESSSRGLVLTGDESYLDSYRTTTLSAEQRETTVRKLTVRNPGQPRRVPALEELAPQKIPFAEMVITRPRAKGFGAAVDAIGGARGERLLGGFQAVVTAVRIALNVSALQLRNRGFIAAIQQAIGIDGHGASGLESESTKSVIMEDAKHSIATLQAIRTLGMSIAIDGFGNGFFSLSSLAKLPLDTLKVDRSLKLDSLPHHTQLWTQLDAHR